jgi:MFS family permease
MVAGAGTVTLTLIYVVSGLGTGLGPIVARHWLGDAPPKLLWGITLGFVLLSVGLLGLTIAPTLGLFLLFTAVRTVGTGVLWVFSAALLQMVIPDGVRGRVFAFEFALLTLTQSVSIYWAGWAQDALGWSVPQVMFSMFVGSVVVLGVWGLFYGWVKTRPWHTPITP